MSFLENLRNRIRAVDPAVGRETQALLDRKTKPRRSLGRLEDLACEVATARGVPVPPLPEKAIVLMAADHGVAAEGVSAYPPEVTSQMVLNFERGGAAINVLARQAGARVVVVDMGVGRDRGTKNFTRGPAMSRAEALGAIEKGARIAAELAEEGVTLVGLGEMGIGNTTASSALTAALTGAAPEKVTGRGTGVDEAGFRRKVDAIRRAIEVNRPDPADPVGVLASLGGLEIAGLAGVTLGAAGAGVPVVMDGFITSVAALTASRIEPKAAGYLIASHRSVERGHALVLAELGKKPLLDLDLRLGEGTGSALAMCLVDAAVRILREMATFEAADVTDSGA